MNPVPEPHGATDAPDLFPPPRQATLSAEPPLFQGGGQGGPARSVSPLTVGLAFAVVVLSAYVAWSWRSAPTAPVAVAAPDPVTPVSPAPSVAEVAQPAEPVQTPASGPQRCESQGKVLYTDQPCAADQTARAVDVSDPLWAGGESITLYRCKGAGQFWSRVHCQHRGAYVTRAYTVPARLPLSDQISFAQNRMADLRPPPTPAPAVAGAVAQAPNDKAWRCKRLAAEVAALDDYARHPLSVGEQDRVRAERRRARDQQFRLRC
jgi:hypothetical protein